jgi:hypothetical protein
MWRLNKEYIGQWLEAKEHEFSIDQNKNSQITVKVSKLAQDCLDWKTDKGDC